MLPRGTLLGDVRQQGTGNRPHSHRVSPHLGQYQEVVDEEVSILCGPTNGVCRNEQLRRKVPPEPQQEVQPGALSVSVHQNFPFTAEWASIRKLCEHIHAQGSVE